MRRRGVSRAAVLWADGDTVGLCLRRDQTPDDQMVLAVAGDSVPYQRYRFHMWMHCGDGRYALLDAGDGDLHVAPEDRLRIVG